MRRSTPKDPQIANVRAADVDRDSAAGVGRAGMEAALSGTAGAELLLVAEAQPTGRVLSPGRTWA